MVTKELLAITELLQPENFVSIRELQKAPSKTLGNGNIKIILNNGKPMGVFFSLEKFEQIKEDLELLQNEKYLKDIEEARNEKDFIPAEKVWEEAGLL